MVNVSKILLLGIATLFVFGNFIYAADDNAFLMGDLNEDNIIDSYDVDFFINYLFKGGEAPSNLDTADLNGNSEVNVADLTLLIKIVYGNLIPGDVDGDGNVDMDDLNFLMDYIWKGGAEPSPLIRADVNLNGEINIADATYLASMLREIDVSGPEITLYKPDDGREFEISGDEIEIDFEYRVEDTSEIEYCELIIDGRIRDRETTIEKGVTEKFEFDLDEGDYDWQIKCLDALGNIGFSEERGFEVDKEDDNNLRYREISSDSSDKEDFRMNIPSPAIDVTIKEQPEGEFKFLDYAPAILFLSIIIVLVFMILAVRKR